MRGVALHVNMTAEFSSLMYSGGVLMLLVGWVAGKVSGL